MVVESGIIKTIAFYNFVSAIMQCSVHDKNDKKFVCIFNKSYCLCLYLRKELHEISGIENSQFIFGIVAILIPSKEKV